MENYNFQDKVVFVTGGAKGIGAGLIRALLSENARHVAFVDIAQKEGASLEKELNNKFGALRAKFIECDIGNEEELSGAFAQVWEKYQRLDVVVNNAVVLASDLNFGVHRRMIEVNFMATVHQALKAVELMRVDKGGCGGTVVNISSLMALSHSPHLAVYSATERAVLHFSNCIGMEYPKTQVRVVSVCFGPTDTAILHRHESFPCEDNKCIQFSFRQSVESAVNGLLEVIRKAESGSTWVVANDKPAEDITPRLKQAHEIISDGLFNVHNLSS